MHLPSTPEVTRCLSRSICPASAPTDSARTRSHRIPGSSRGGRKSERSTRSCDRRRTTTRTTTRAGASRAAGSRASRALPPTQGQSGLTCPNCHAPVDSGPRRRCTACGRFVRAVIDRPRGQALRAATDGDATRGPPRIKGRRAWLQLAGAFADESAFDATEQRLKDSGLDSRPREVFWTLAIEGLVAAISSGDASRIVETYRHLATVSSRQAGNPSTMSGETFTLLAGANRATLQDLIARGIERVEVRPDDCAQCQRDRGARLDPRAELAATRLPYIDCELGACTCEYAPSARALRMRRPVPVMLKSDSVGSPGLPRPPAVPPVAPATEPPIAAEARPVFRLPDAARPLRAVGPGHVSAPPDTSPPDTSPPNTSPLDCPQCANSRSRGAAFCRACGRALRPAAQSVPTSQGGPSTSGS